MPRTKSKAQRKIAGVVVAPKARAKNPPRTAFRKGGPNPHAFVAGNGSPNPGGKPRTSDHLLSKSLRVALADHAPDEVCKAMNLPPHSSWSQCLARKLIYMAIRGDLASIAEIRTCTEGSRISADLSFPDPAAVPPLISLCFVESNGNGKPLYDTPDGMPLALPAEVSD
jgi:hypothetical protein